MSESKHFEDYLRGDSAVSARYRAEATEAPPPELDATILAQATEAVHKPGGRGLSPFGSRRNASLSLAAVVVLTVTVVALLPEARHPDPASVQQSPPKFDARERARTQSDTVLGDAPLPVMTQPAGESKSEVGPAEREMQSPAPALQLGRRAPARHRDSGAGVRNAL